MDGEEREILVDLQNIADFEDTIAGPGWSPSGTWFAWTLFSQEGKAAGFVLDQRTTKIISLNESTGDMQRVELKWSPTQDILLVSNVYPQQTGEVGLLRYTKFA